MTAPRSLLFALSALILLSTQAAAQVDTWHVRRTFVAPTTISWNTFGSGAINTVTELPSTMCIGGAAMSADRSTFYVIAGDELLRYDTATRSMLPSQPSPITCEFGERMAISPDDQWWYFFGLSRVVIVNAASRAVVVNETRADVLRELRFAPDGRMRFELSPAGYIDGGMPNAWRLRAISDPQSTTPTWEAVMACDGGCTAGLATNVASVYVRLTPEPVAMSPASDLRAFDANTGSQHARVTLPAKVEGLAAGRDRVFLAGQQSLGGPYLVGAFDPRTFAAIRLAAFTSAPFSHPSALQLSQDESLLYLDITAGSPSGARTQVLESTTLTPVTGPPYDFFIFENPATPQVPAAPTLRALGYSGNRVTVSWHPDAGATPTAFAIAGATRGQPTSTLAVGDDEARAWESPPLPDGSYTLNVRALNLAGASVAAVAVFGIGNTGVPGAPINLSAEIAADTAFLAWQPAPAGPAPTEYVIEAAGAGSGAFGAAGRVSLPYLHIARIPHGTWDVRVRAATATGVSEPSNVITITAGACSAPPPTPAGFAAVVAGYLVTLRWDRVQSAEDFVIEAGIGSGTTLARFATGTPWPFIDVAAPPFPGDYFVRVRARNACGLSGASPELTVRVP